VLVMLGGVCGVMWFEYISLHIEVQSHLYNLSDTPEVAINSPPVVCVTNISILSRDY
jgi:hypothetical protein